MDPTRSALSRQALAKVLDALERKNPITRRELGELSSVSPSTAARAARYLTEAGILTLSDGRSDAEHTDRRAGSLSLSPAAILPILTSGQAVGTVHALNARSELLGTAVMELNRQHDGEESLRLLCRRAMTLLRGCAKASGLPVAAPVLLTEGRLSEPRAWIEAVTDTMGVPPMAILEAGDAIAYGLRWEPLPPDAASLLCLRTGESRAAYLLARTENGAWCPSPPTQTLSRALNRYVSLGDGSAASQRRDILRFIRDLSDFIPPDVLLMEDPRGLFREESAWRELLPDGMAVLLREPPREELSLPILGAAAYARRLLWDRVIAPAP